MALAAGLIAMATTASGSDDTARFNGTWQTSFSFNGQMVTMVSVHDGSGYKNYVVSPRRRTKAISEQEVKNSGPFHHCDADQHSTIAFEKFEKLQPPPDQYKFERDGASL